MAMIKTRHGSCHCGAIKFQVDIDLAPEGQRSPQARPGPWFSSTLRCNCSICLKARIWKNHVAAEQFQLLAGEEQLTHYRFASRAVDHVFCKVCGVRPFATSSEEVMGGDFVCVNVACLDDVSPEEFAAAPVRFEDGAEDDWSRPPRVTSHL